MYKDIFLQDIQNYLAAYHYEAPLQVSYSDFEDFHYQSSIGFILKKKYPDFDIQHLIEYLQKNTHYEQVSLTGSGFISVKVKITFNETTNLNNPAQTILVDYCGVNVAKQMHIGHIRSMFIGDFIVRLHEALGDNVIIQNHIGDWGNQFGFLLHYIQENQLQTNLSNKNLTQYYKKAYIQYQQDEVFAQQSDRTAYLLQQGSDKALYELWKTCVQVSLEEAQKTFKEFNLKMDLSHTCGESFYAPMCQEILKTLLDKKIATKEADGSVVVFFDKKSPLVLQKSNGNYLYALYDLAAIHYRVKTFQPNKIVYVVDKRQALHFEQVFEVAQKAGFASHTYLEHVGFGTILGKDKKPLKTKTGESLYLDELLAQGKEILLGTEQFQKLNTRFKEMILNKTIVGGMKYYDLKFNKGQDYIFDWEHVLNFTGGSAPYIQNAYVRIDSILYKKGLSQSPEIDWAEKWNKIESELIFQAQKTQELCASLTQAYSSQALATQMIKLCQTFHHFYESEKVLGSAREAQKLQVLGFVQNTLKQSSDILGIELYECAQKLEIKPMLKP